MNKNIEINNKIMSAHLSQMAVIQNGIRKKSPNKNKRRVGCDKFQEQPRTTDRRADKTGS